MIRVSCRRTLILLALAMLTLPGVALGGPIGGRSAEVPPSRILQDSEKVETYGSHKWSPSSTKDGTGIVICGGQFTRGRCRVESEGLIGVLGAKEKAPYIQLSEAIISVHPQAKVIDTQVQGSSLRVYYRIDSKKSAVVDDGLPTGFGIDFKGNSSDGEILNLWYWIAFWVVILLVATNYVLWSLRRVSLPYVQRDTSEASAGVLSQTVLANTLAIPQEVESCPKFSAGISCELSASRSVAKRKIILE